MGLLTCLLTFFNCTVYDAISKTDRMIASLHYRTRLKLNNRKGKEKGMKNARFDG